MRSVSILGSTGSIGCSTLKVIEHLGDFRVVAMAAGRNMSRFADQISAFRPEVVSCFDEFHAAELESELHSRGAQSPRIETGDSGIIEVATIEKAEIVVSAAVGAVGCVPTLRAIEAGKRVAIANKETLVMAGELMTAAARKSGAEILPVDSEHNAIHQCLRGEKASEVRRLILTASGGPFLNKSTAEIENATRDEALNHPKWKMGEKITIDSATLMNKGLEVIEARWLFDFDAERIDVLVHPQSIVHSMVEMIDGSVIAQMGVTDMQHAIQYALTFPERRAASLPPLDLATLSELNFEAPDLNRFPCLGLAYKALRAGGTMPAVLNAANETAVAAFLDGRIRLPEIAEIIGSVLSAYDNQAADSIETVLAADRWARESATMRISGSLSPATAATGSHV